MPWTTDLEVVTSQAAAAEDAMLRPAEVRARPQAARPNMERSLERWIARSPASRM